MKMTDPSTKLRIDVSAIFKKYDKSLSGEITRQEYTKLHRELTREKLVKVDMDSAVSALDSLGDGIVSFNQFISWIEKV